MKFWATFFFLIISTSPAALAQYFNTGQDPASIKWLQIKTKRYTLIYPESYGKEGLNYARSLDESFSKLASFHTEKKIRLPVIIHNYTTFSNGYVAWAPKRIELYPTPEQNGIPANPIEQLTTHELTHVLQMSSLNTGFTRIMSILSGEQFTGAISALLPLWFMEGDAVFAETLFSPSGRGKTPSFLKEMKAIALERPKRYSYDKILSGSFRNFTPDHYRYGYQMVAWSYANYGMKLWNKTLDFTGKYPFSLNPVNISLYENAKLSKSKLYSETFDSLKSIWQREEKRINPVSYQPVNPSKGREYINYLSPVVIGKDSIIAIKTSFRNIPEFVLINPTGKTEKRVHFPGNMYPYFLSASNRKLVWVEDRPDPVWDNRTFSVIKIMDIRNKSIRQLSFRTRYLAASISQDGRFIAAVENSIGNENFLIIMDSFGGGILERIPVPGNAYPQRPQWSHAGDEICMIALSAEGEGIISWSLKNKKWQTLLDPGRDDLQSALIRNDSLFYVSSSSGTDNVFLQTPEKHTLKLTNSRFGAYDVIPAGENIIFSDYRAEGFNICSANIRDAMEYNSIRIKDPSFLINRFDTLRPAGKEEPPTSYKPERYLKIAHLFRFHSWMPLYADLEQIKSDPTAVRPGFTLMSQNQLSTLTSTIGYEYAADRTHQIHAKVTWRGLIPVIESQLDYGANAQISKMNSSVADPLAIQPGLSFTNTISLPLNFSTGRFSQYMRFLLSDEYDNNYIYIREKNTYDYGQSLTGGRIIFYNYQNTAIRDINPRWGQVVDLNYTFAPFDQNIYGSINALKTAFYFPGIFRNHSIRLRYETEIQHPQKLLYFNSASLPRGYIDIIPEKINFLSGEYVMPLVYPDLNIPGFLFLQRIRSTLFYDYAEGTRNHYLITKQTHNYTETFKSFGAEITADYFILRIPFMISTGVAAIWKSINELPAFELVFNADIFGMKIGRNRGYKSLH